MAVIGSALLATGGLAAAVAVVTPPALVLRPTAAPPGTRVQVFLPDVPPALNTQPCTVSVAGQPTAADCSVTKGILTATFTVPADLTVPDPEVRACIPDCVKAAFSGTRTLTVTKSAAKPSSVPPPASASATPSASALSASAAAPSSAAATAAARSSSGSSSGRSSAASATSRPRPGHTGVTWPLSPPQTGGVAALGLVLVAGTGRVITRRPGRGAMPTVQVRLRTHPGDPPRLTGVHNSRVHSVHLRLRTNGPTTEGPQP